MPEVLLDLKNIFKEYEAKGDTGTMVLENINLSVYEGEFVAILGPSGSGKSTLLRIIAGLVPPSAGKVTYLGKPITGVNPGVAMVFQSFALFPWLTVLENVMLGLEGKKLSEKVCRQKALEAVDMVGLDGFENAYPKELSGGMRQRVGIGRALVSDPDVLLMDEPFSALDVLTAENLRRDLLELWLEKKITTKAIILVTHGIEEAVYMADRAVILSSGPAKVIRDAPIRLPRWRNKKDPQFITLVDGIYSLMTKRDKDKAGDRTAMSELPTEIKSSFTPVPHVSAEALTGFLELLEDLNETTDLYKLAEKFNMDIEDFFPIVDGATMLNFAKIVEGDISLTPAGIEFARATVLRRKELFQRQLLASLSFVRQIMSFLESKSNKRMNIEFFEELLERSFSPQEVQRQLQTIIRWGRYAELFAYDEQSGQLFIEQA